MIKRILKAVFNFVLPFAVLAATLVAGFGLLKLLEKADADHEALMRPHAGTMKQTTTAPANIPVGPYCWLPKYDPKNSIENRIPAPPGYTRVIVEPGQWQDWLRKLPLKPDGSKVKLYNGQERPNYASAGVIDIDAGGNADLQHGSNAIVRLRAEYQYSRQRYRSIHFNFADNTLVEYWKWAEDIRPRYEGNALKWTKPPRNFQKDYSYATFRSYVDAIMGRSDAATLNAEMQPTGPLKLLQIGHVFITPGKPGHAVVVIDVAEGPNGRKAFLLAQAFSPAQDIHLIKNTRPADTRILPWFDVNFGPVLKTPDWTFKRTEARRFK